MQSKQPSQWRELIKTFGMFDAQIMAGRLEAEGIPVRIVPAEAGHRLGITIGKLGEVAIEVPEPYLESAAAVIETDYSDEFDEDDFDEDFDEDDEYEDD